MTLNDTLLQKLADWHPAPGRQTLAVADEAAGWSVVLAAEQNDRLGCLVWELTLRLDRPPAPLADWAATVADRVTGLLEPLRVVEVDPERGAAQLRSDEPSRRADRPVYYELLLERPAQATLRRYQGGGPAGERREQVAFALTHEVVAKVVADLVG
jgi:hypothetical protein